MNPQTIEKLEEEFRTFPVMSSGPPDPDSWAKEVSKLDFMPPEDYVDFIQRFGGSIVGSYSIIGIGTSPAMGSEEGSIAEFTAMYREDEWPRTQDWQVFSKDLGGNPIGFDREGIVRSWDHDARELLYLADSFEDFLIKFCFQ